MRLAYSIAIQVDFDILLLDEVLAVGDQEFQGRCFETLAEIRAAGKTIVFVSHDLKAIRDTATARCCSSTAPCEALGEPGAVIARYGSQARRSARATLRRATS